MMMRYAIALFLAVSVTGSPGLGNEPMEPVNTGLSATKARDINGFELGMPIQDAIKRVDVTFQQGELVQSNMNGTAYDFGVCPSGRIYRIESRQELGNFIPDKGFTDKLRSDLYAKYGAAGDASAQSLNWDLIEPVRYADGGIRPFKTNWFSVLLSGGVSGPLSLDLRMLDFRICWEDKVRANKQPRDEASKKIIF